MNNIYLALYKGQAKSRLHRVVDWVIRKATGGIYSHCEIAVEQRIFHTGERLPDIHYDCYSASPRDGGVRCKQIDVANRAKWDLIPLTTVSEAQIKAFYEQTKGRRYDFIGAIGTKLGIAHSRSRYFCSEWCGELLGLPTPAELSPNDLADILWRRR